MAVGFTADIWVDVAILLTALGVGLMGKVEPPLYGCFGSLLLLSFVGHWGLLQQRVFVKQIGAGVQLGTKLPF